MVVECGICLLVLFAFLANRVWPHAYSVLGCPGNENYNLFLQLSQLQSESFTLYSTGFKNKKTQK
ncbi:hypothetical protein M758_2G075100 [Ceratodon purpureus]|uniref:Secreted protein n=1 Tax=Ceratodon purpureus TaxID=3225 RepID=A0A8T0IS22_CERPU|nr:hypothetical protein KC19_2G098000 [Ceratodon purpureus]KAG0625706.1 hypothetical protein M758_2G075100 [Ceratodon purpureus]